MRFVLLLILPLFLLVPPRQAAAAPDAAGAEALKKEINDALSWYKSVSSLMNENVEIARDVTVVPGEKYYQVTIPGVSAALKAGFSIDIGTIVAHMEKDEDTGAWLISAAIPREIFLRDAAGDAVGAIGFGAQKFTAAWLPKLDVFHKYEAHYQDVTFKPLQKALGDISLTVPHIVAARNLEQDGKGLWSGPQIFTITGAKFAARDDKSDMKLSAARVEGREDITRGHIGTPDSVRAKVLQLSAQDKKDAAETGKILASIIEESMTMPEAFTKIFRAAGLSATVAYTPTEQGGKTTHDISIGQVEAVSDIKGASSDIGEGGFRLTLKDAKISGMPPGLEGLAPTAANLETRFERVPMEKMLETGVSLLSAVLKTPPDQRGKGMASLPPGVRAEVDRLPQIMMDAGTTATIKDTYITTADLDVMADGKLAANAQSPLRVAGTVTLALHKLDEMIQKFQSSTSDPNILRHAQGAVILQALGQLETAADGKSMRKYVFEFKPDGQVMMNGADIGIAAQMMLPKKKEPAAATTPAQEQGTATPAP